MYAKVANTSSIKHCIIISEIGNQYAIFRARTDIITVTVTIGTRKLCNFGTVIIEVL